MIIDDIHKIRIGVVNISQPSVVDAMAAGRRLSRRQCLMAPVSHQAVSIRGTAAEIRAEAQRLRGLVGAVSGGFVGYAEEYGVMGMSAENYRACAEVRCQLGCPQPAARVLGG